MNMEACDWEVEKMEHYDKQDRERRNENMNKSLTEERRAERETGRREKC